MSQPTRLYVPPRNVIGLLVPTLVATWYFIDKAGTDTRLKVLIFLLAISAQVVMVVVSSRTRRTRRPFFWSVYDFLTGNGKLPLRLLTNGVVLLAVIALGFEISGLQRPGGVPSSFIARYVEVDLYWTLLNFIGVSEGSITPVGFSKALTILATTVGIIFWGMYISILVNKHLEMQELFKQRFSQEQLDSSLFNEGQNQGQQTNLPQRSGRRRRK